MQFGQYFLPRTSNIEIKVDLAIAVLFQLYLKQRTSNMKANLIFLNVIDTLQFWDYWKEQLFNVDTNAVLAKVAYIKY